MTCHRCNHVRGHAIYCTAPDNVHPPLKDEVPSDPVQGVYRLPTETAPHRQHYQLLFTAELVDDVPRQDDDVRVWMYLDKFYAGPDARRAAVILTARAHSAMRQGERVVVYVPLSSDRPGRRISVRRALEWGKFEYVGQEVVATKTVLEVVGKKSRQGPP